MTDEIIRLNDRLDKVFDLIGDQQKAHSIISSELRSHLDSSAVANDGYKKEREESKITVKDLEARVKAMEEWITYQKNKQKQIETVGSLIKWIIGTIVGIITIFVFWSKR